jgi:ectoine hydroxylase-related dioxygenase (phytanoyl-CoA dioxygenase family)
MEVRTKPFTLDAHELKLLPTPDDVRFYKQHGYYVSDIVFSEREIDLLVKAANAYYAGHRDRRLPFVPTGATYWATGSKSRLRQNNYITYESEAMRSVLLKPLIAAIAARLAETHEIRLFIDVLRYKAPGESKETTIGWHIDRHYWQMFTSDAMLTAFIPLHDCFDEDGTIIMIDGSNHWHEAVGPDDSTALHFAQRDVNDLERRVHDEAAANNAVVTKVPILLKKGQISFHNSLTYHGSLPTRSSRPRQTISLHFQDETNQYRRHVLESGKLASHHTAQLCSRQPNGDPDYRDPKFFPVLWHE